MEALVITPLHHGWGARRDAARLGATLTTPCRAFGRRVFWSELRRLWRFGTARLPRRTWRTTSSGTDHVLRTRRGRRGPRLGRTALLHSRQHHRHRSASG